MPLPLLRQGWRRDLTLRVDPHTVYERNHSNQWSDTELWEGVKCTERFNVELWNVYIVIAITKFLLYYPNAIKFVVIRGHNIRIILEYIRILKNRKVLNGEAKLKACWLFSWYGGRVVVFRLGWRRVCPRSWNMYGYSTSLKYDSNHCWSKCCQFTKTSSLLWRSPNPIASLTRLRLGAGEEIKTNCADWSGAISARSFKLTLLTLPLSLEPPTRLPTPSAATTTQQADVDSRCCSNSSYRCCDGCHCLSQSWQANRQPPNITTTAENSDLAPAECLRWAWTQQQANRHLYTYR